MNNHIPKKEGTISSSSISPEPSLPFSRRKFIAGVSIAAAGISIVPRHVLGGKGFIAPSDKLTMALIGAGTQGLRELPELLRIPEIQLVAVCDPQKDAHGYFDWNPTSLRDHLREFSGMKEWKPGKKTNIPGGRDNAKTIVDAWYARQSGSLTGTGCRTYADFREMFEKEKDINAIKVMTPDHLHGIIAMSAMKRGMHVTLHKPVSNRLLEGLKVIQAEKSNTLTTHLIPWDYNGSMKQIMAWINGGVIGTLQEIHNWSNRPVWPQYAQIPKEKKKVPKGLDWDLWLGPEAERPYHPHYTHMVFRGWYDFGGGAMADMGHYSLWTVFNALNLENPHTVEPCLSHVCGIDKQGAAYRFNNDYSFPYASSVRLRYPFTRTRPAVDLIWYDGGMKPPVPDEFYTENMEFPAEGMMFVGEKGKIMSKFFVGDPYVLSGDKKLAKELSINEEKTEKISGIQRFVEGCLRKEKIAGGFGEAWPLTEAVNLYAVALRAGKSFRYDPLGKSITSDPDLNKYLKREYRAGWELEG